MAIPVLATIPELPADGRPAVAAPEPAAAAPEPASGPAPRPAVPPPARPPRRVRPRADFPGASVAALAVIAAAVWSLIAIREVKQPAAHDRGVRLAAEPAAAQAAGTTLR